MAEANRQALADARRLADYLDKLPTPVQCIDRDFRIVYINKAGAAIAGLDQTSCTGRHCYEFFSNAHCQTMDCRLGRAMRTKLVEEAETVLDPGGLNMPVRYTGAAILDDTGEVIGALEYIVDISENKKAFTAIEKENWIQSGAAVVNDRLRGEQSLNQLCDNLLSGLAQRLPILAAAMYVLEDDMLQLRGTYAATGANTAREQFAVGEGLVGQAAREQKTLVVEEIPAESVRMVASNVEAIPGNWP